MKALELKLKEWELSVETDTGNVWVVTSGQNSLANTQITGVDLFDARLNNVNTIQYLLTVKDTAGNRRTAASQVLTVPLMVSLKPSPDYTILASGQQPSINLVYSINKDVNSMQMDILKNGITYKNISINNQSDITAGEHSAKYWNGTGTGITYTAAGEYEVRLICDSQTLTENVRIYNSPAECASDIAGLGEQIGIPMPYFDYKVVGSGLYDIAMPYEYDVYGKATEQWNKHYTQEFVSLHMHMPWLTGIGATFSGSASGLIPYTQDTIKLKAWTTGCAVPKVKRATIRRNNGVVWILDGITDNTYNLPMQIGDSVELYGKIGKIELGFLTGCDAWLDMKAIYSGPISLGGGDYSKNTVPGMVVGTGNDSNEGILYYHRPNDARLFNLSFADETEDVSVSDKIHFGDWPYMPQHGSVINYAYQDGSLNIDLEKAFVPQLLNKEMQGQSLTNLSYDVTGWGGNTYRSGKTYFYGAYGNTNTATSKNSPVFGNNTNVFGGTEMIYGFQQGTMNIAIPNKATVTVACSAVISYTMKYEKKYWIGPFSYTITWNDVKKNLTLESEGYLINNEELQFDNSGITPGTKTALYTTNGYCDFWQVAVNNINNAQYSSDKNIKFTVKSFMIDKVNSYIPSVSENYLVYAPVITDPPTVVVSGGKTSFNNQQVKLQFSNMQLTTAKVIDSWEVLQSDNKRIGGNFVRLGGAFTTNIMKNLDPDSGYPFPKTYEAPHTSSWTVSGAYLPDSDIKNYDVIITDAVGGGIGEINEENHSLTINSNNEVFNNPAYKVGPDGFGFGKTHEEYFIDKIKLKLRPGSEIPYDAHTYVAIKGSLGAAGNCDFTPAKYSLYYKKNGFTEDGSPDNDDYHLIKNYELDSAITNGTLGYLYARDKIGKYRIKLSAFDTGRGLAVEQERDVLIGHKITSADGGMATDAYENVFLFFPPDSLNKDLLMRITPADKAGYGLLENVSAPLSLMYSLAACPVTSTTAGHLKTTDFKTDGFNTVGGTTSDGKVHRPGILRIMYTQEMLGGIPETALNLYKVDESNGSKTVKRMSSFVDTTNHELYAQIDSFSSIQLVPDYSPPGYEFFAAPDPANRDSAVKMIIKSDSTLAGEVLDAEITLPYMQNPPMPFNIQFARQDVEYLNGTTGIYTAITVVSNPVFDDYKLILNHDVDTGDMSNLPNDGVTGNDYNQNKLIIGTTLTVYFANINGVQRPAESYLINRAGMYTEFAETGNSPTSYWVSLCTPAQYDAKIQDGVNLKSTGIFEQAASWLWTGTNGASKSGSFGNMPVVSKRLSLKTAGTKEAIGLPLSESWWQGMSLKIENDSGGFTPYRISRGAEAVTVTGSDTEGYSLSVLINNADGENEEITSELNNRAWKLCVPSNQYAGMYYVSEHLPPDFTGRTLAVVSWQGAGLNGKTSAGRGTFVIDTSSPVVDISLNTMLAKADDTVIIRAKAMYTDAVPGLLLTQADGTTVTAQSVTDGSGAGVIPGTNLTTGEVLYTYRVSATDVTGFLDIQAFVPGTSGNITGTARVFIDNTVPVFRLENYPTSPAGIGEFGFDLRMIPSADDIAPHSVTLRSKPEVIGYYIDKNSGVPLGGVQLYVSEDASDPALYKVKADVKGHYKSGLWNSLPNNGGIRIQITGTDRAGNQGIFDFKAVPGQANPDLYVPIELDTDPPAPPENVRVYLVDNTGNSTGGMSIDIDWDNNTFNTDVITYALYRNDVFLVTRTAVNTVKTQSYSDVSITAVNEGGRYSYYVTAMDMAGNVSAPAYGQLVYDNTPPETSMDIIGDYYEPYAGKYFMAPNASIMLSAVDVTSGVERIEYGFGGNTPAAYSLYHQPFAYAYSNTLTAFYYRASDKAMYLTKYGASVTVTAGNIEDPAKTALIYVDSKAPSITVTAPGSYSGLGGTMMLSSHDDINSYTDEELEELLLGFGLSVTQAAKTDRAAAIDLVNAAYAAGMTPMLNAPDINSMTYEEIINGLQAEGMAYVYSGVTVTTIQGLQKATMTAEVFMQTDEFLNTANAHIYTGYERWSNDYLESVLIQNGTPAGVIEDACAATLLSRFAVQLAEVQTAGMTSDELKDVITAMGINIYNTYVCEQDALRKLLINSSDYAAHSCRYTHYLGWSYDDLKYVFVNDSLRIAGVTVTADAAAYDALVATRTVEYLREVLKDIKGMSINMPKEGLYVNGVTGELHIYPDDTFASADTIYDADNNTIYVSSDPGSGVQAVGYTVTNMATDVKLEYSVVKSGVPMAGPAVVPVASYAPDEGLYMIDTITVDMVGNSMGSSGVGPNVLYFITDKTPPYVSVTYNDGYGTYMLLTATTDITVTEPYLTMTLYSVDQGAIPCGTGGIYYKTATETAFSQYSGPFVLAVVPGATLQFEYYGVDRVGNSSAVRTLNIAALDRQLEYFEVKAPPSVQSNAGFCVTITAKDDRGLTVTNYTGSVSVTSTAALYDTGIPGGTYTFTAQDMGSKAFCGARIVSSGTQYIYAEDSQSGKTGSSGAINVVNSAAAGFVIEAPASVTAGQNFNITVYAKDGYNNTVPGYTGSITFGSSDNSAQLPGTYIFTLQDAGKKIFEMVSLKAKGIQTVNVRDLNDAAVNGTSSNIAVSAGSAAAVTVSAPSLVNAGTTFNFIITVQDPFGNAVDGYTGTVSFTSTDSSAVLPPDYTFTGTEGGVRVLEAVFETQGVQTITVSGASVSGTSGPINVSSASGTRGRTLLLTSRLTAENTYAYCYVQAANMNFNVANDTKLEYEVFVPDFSSNYYTSLEFTGSWAALNAAGSSQTGMRDLTFGGSYIADQNNIRIHPSMDISAYAKGRWYKRVFDIGAMNDTTVPVDTSDNVQKLFLSQDTGNIGKNGAPSNRQGTFNAVFDNIKFTGTNAYTVFENQQILNGFDADGNGAPDDVSATVTDGYGWQGGASAPQNSMIWVVEGMTVTLSPASGVQADGTQEYTVTATLTTPSGTGIRYALVDFVSDRAEDTVVPQINSGETYAVTDNTGSAYAVVRSSKAGTATITVRAAHLTKVVQLYFAPAPAVKTAVKPAEAVLLPGAQASLGIRTEDAAGNFSPVTNDIYVNADSVTAQFYSQASGEWEQSLTLNASSAHNVLVRDTNAAAHDVTVNITSPGLASSAAVLHINVSDPVSLQAQLLSVTVTAGATGMFTVRALDAQGVAVYSNAAIHVTSSASQTMKFSADGVTWKEFLDINLVNGNADIYFRDTTAGADNAVSISNSVLGTAQVHVCVTSGPAHELTATADAYSVTAGNSVNITAFVRDEFGNPVTGKRVSFTARAEHGTPSVLPAYGDTDSNGRVQAVFTTSTIAAMNYCTVNSGMLAGKTVTISGSSTTGTRSYRLSPSVLTTGADKAAVLRLNVRDAGGYNTPAPSGHEQAVISTDVFSTDVLFYDTVSSAWLNSVTVTVNTDGMAEVQVKSHIPGTYSLSAAETSSSPVITAASSVLNITTGYYLSVSPVSQVYAGAGTQVTITAQITDQNGNSVNLQGMYLRFTTTYGSLDYLEAVTDSEGRADVVLTVSTLPNKSHVVCVTADELGETVCSEVIESMPQISFDVTAPATVNAGDAFTVIVRAKDIYNTTVTGYTGTVSLTCTASSYVMPADYTFNAGDMGLHTFAGVKIKEPGVFTVTAGDTTDSAITGTSGDITVVATPTPVLDVAWPQTGKDSARSFRSKAVGFSDDPKTETDNLDFVGMDDRIKKHSFPDGDSINELLIDNDGNAFVFCGNNLYKVSESGSLIFVKSNMTGRVMLGENSVFNINDSYLRALDPADGTVLAESEDHHGYIITDQVFIDKSSNLYSRRLQNYLMKFSYDGSFSCLSSCGLYGDMTAKEDIGYAIDEVGGKYSIRWIKPLGFNASGPGVSYNTTSDDMDGIQVQVDDDTIIFANGEIISRPAYFKGNSVSHAPPLFKYYLVLSPNETDKFKVPDSNISNELPHGTFRACTNQFVFVGGQNNNKIFVYDRKLAPPPSLITGMPSDSYVTTMEWFDTINERITTDLISDANGKIYFGTDSGIYILRNANQGEVVKWDIPGVKGKISIGNNSKVYFQNNSELYIVGDGIAIPVPENPCLTVPPQFFVVEENGVPKLIFPNMDIDQIGWNVYSTGSPYQLLNKDFVIKNNSFYHISAQPGRAYTYIITKIDKFGRESGVSVPVTFTFRTPTATPTATETATEVLTPTITMTHSVTETSTLTATDTATVSPTVSETVTATATVTATSTITPTYTPTCTDCIETADCENYKIWYSFDNADNRSENTGVTGYSAVIPANAVFTSGVAGNSSYSAGPFYSDKKSEAFYMNLNPKIMAAKDVVFEWKQHIDTAKLRANVSSNELFLFASGGNYNSAGQPQRIAVRAEKYGSVPGTAAVVCEYTGWEGLETLTLDNLTDGWYRIAVKWSGASFNDGTAGTGAVTIEAYRINMADRTETPAGADSGTIGMYFGPVNTDMQLSAGGNSYGLYNGVIDDIMMWNCPGTLQLPTHTATATPTITHTATATTTITPTPTPPVVSLVLYSRDSGVVQSEQLTSYLEIHNYGSNLDMKDITVKYWYKGENPELPETVEAGYAGFEDEEGVLTNMPEKVSATVNAIFQGDQNRVAEFSFAPDTGLLTHNARYMFSFVIQKADGSVYDKDNDWSYYSFVENADINTRVTLYYGGNLVWGEEPGIKHTPTQTPTVTPTQTCTPTQPEGTPTFTPTATATPGEWAVSALGGSVIYAMTGAGAGTIYSADVSDDYTSRIFRTSYNASVSDTIQVYAPGTVVMDMKADTVSDVLYAAGYDGKMYKAQNISSSAVWSNVQVTEGNPLLSMCIDSNNSNNIICSGVDGLFASSDGGSTWQSAADGTGNSTAVVTQIVQSDTHSNIYYLVTHKGAEATGGIYIYDSVNDTIQLLDFAGEGTRYITPDCNSTGSFYLLVNGESASSVYYYDYTTGVFAKLQADLPTQYIFSLQKSCYCASGPELYAAGEGGAYVSRDNGISWENYSYGLTETVAYSILTDPVYGRVFINTSSGIFGKNMCEGFVLPTRTATPTVTQTATITATVTPTMTVTPTDTVTATVTETVTSTVTETATPSVTVTATETVTGTVTQSVTMTVTETATGTMTPSVTGTVTETVTATVTKTATETATMTVTGTSTVTPSCTPTATMTVTNTPTMAVVLKIKTDNTAETTNSPHPQFMLISNDPRTIDMSLVELRYWYMFEGDTQTETAYIDYAGIQPAGTNITGSTTAGIANVYYGAGQDRYLRVTFGSGSLLNGDYAVINTRFNKNDWSGYNQINDRSFYGVADYTVWDKVCVYYNGVKIWGVEPDINEPPPTVTVTPEDTAISTFTQTATASVTATGTKTVTVTGTKTVTATGTATMTATFTKTATATGTMTVTRSVTSSATRTFTATGTNTMTATKTATKTVTATVTVSATRSVTPSATPQASATASVTPQAYSMSLSYKSTDNNQNTNSPKPNFKLYNNSASDIELSRVKIRYWYKFEGTSQTESAVVDYAGRTPNGTNITSYVTASIVQGSFGDQDRYMEVSFKFGAGSIGQGGFAEIQSRFNKNDWSSYDQSNDWSYAGYTDFTTWTHVTVYLDGSLVFGQQPQGMQPASVRNVTTAKFEALAENNVYNYPNPFSGETTIRFSLDKAEEVVARIYDIKGMALWKKHLKAWETRPGINSFIWDGKIFGSVKSANGVYTLEITAGGKTVKKKMVVLNETE